MDRTALPFNMLYNLRPNSKVELIIKGYVFLICRIRSLKELLVDLIKPGGGL